MSIGDRPGMDEPGPDPITRAATAEMIAAGDQVVKHFGQPSLWDGRFTRRHRTGPQPNESCTGIESHGGCGSVRAHSSRRRP